MPIRATCQCGYTLAVPDEMAGKRGKCPKCKEILQIPPSGAGTAKPATSGVAKGGGTQGGGGGPVPTPAPTGMASLFDEVGLVQKTGRSCPSCDAPVPPNTVLCVNCGFNFAEGTKIDGVKVAAARQFGNKHLNEAAAMMSREKSTEDRLLGAGAPWWMMLSILVGIIVFIAGLGIKMAAGTSGELSTVEWMRRIQEATYLVVLVGTIGMAMALVNVFSVLAILITAFKESTKEGLLTFFAPFYIYYYMFSRLFSQFLVTTVAIYWVSGILAGVCLAYALPKI